MLVCVVSVFSTNLTFECPFFALSGSWELMINFIVGILVVDVVVAAVASKEWLYHSVSFHLFAFVELLFTMTHFIDNVLFACVFVCVS